MIRPAFKSIEMSGTISTANQLLRVENQSLKVKVENLELKLENQQFKHEETVKTLRASYEEQINALKGNRFGSGGDLVAGSNKRKLEAINVNELILKAKKKQIEQLSEKEQSVLEGINKFLLRKRAASNFFPAFTSWANWANNNVDHDEVIKFDNYIFIKRSMSGSWRQLIHLSEIEDFPTMNSFSETVLPVIGNGWRRANTKLYLIDKYEFEDVTSSLTEEIEEAEIGKSFSFDMKNNFKWHNRWKSNSYSYCMLVFVKELN